MSRIRFFDATLRDGSHAIKHQLTKETITSYCRAMDDAGMYTIVVGHGNGLGASSLQVGLSLLSEEEMLTTARENLKHTKLGAYLIPGFGTIKDNIEPAIEYGVDLFKIGCHCTEADTTRQHIEFVRNKGLEVYGILMMYHMASTEKILEEAQKMQTYGANGVILMDSAGASTPEMVKRTIATLADCLDIKVGFHPHNNLGLAISNAYIAIKEGASIIDGTLRGFGAGAGNVQLEALSALLQKEGYELNHDLYRLFDVSKEIVKPIMPEDRALTDISIVSGMAGIFSAFKIHVLNAAKEFNVDPRDIMMELGKRKVVGGQEDMIVEVAEQLANPIKSDTESYMLESLS
ncbi:4-hydroxy-2-oxovalerate aldolase [Butyrivibrio sp. WCD3002]|uniref:4-hydroxy-2-oxovalerate aldolase n=1 Tax=Butyrivibrio sp. WCD3002 TaxID=1280676 RepID=UPI00047ADFE7|nr:4-hydroxy-2-oxovalerate aldolase [Butyrivibrio sp. WCD3002]